MTIEHEEMLNKLMPQNPEFFEKLRELCHNKESINKILIDFITKNEMKHVRSFNQDKLNFSDFMTSKDRQNQIPTNCLHISIAYMIYRKQDGVKQDPTENGRNIKRAHMYVTSPAQVHRTLRQRLRTLPPLPL